MFAQQHPGALVSIPGIPQTIIYFYIGEVYRRHWLLEESGQMLDNVDRTHLVVLAS